MDRLERFLWTLRGNAALHVVEEYDDAVDAFAVPAFVWLVTAGFAYAAAEALTLDAVFSPLGVFATVALGYVLFVLLRVAVTFTLASKYYVTEWTGDVDPPEGVR